jgi:hypothetical protein
MPTAVARRTARWIHRGDLTPERPSMLELTVPRKDGVCTEAYWVTVVGPDRYLLEKAGEWVNHHVALGAAPVCTCKDAAYRNPGRCKHVLGLRAALAR